MIPDVPTLAFSFSLPPNIYMLGERQAPLEAVVKPGHKQLPVKPVEALPGDLGSQVHRSMGAAVRGGRKSFKGLEH